MNDTTEQEQRELVSWRCEQLARVGFPFRDAVLLARDARYDLHELVDLVGRGCEPALAVRILAPFEDRAA